MLVGYAAGSLFEFGSEKRKDLFLKIAVTALLMFVIIRLVNIYGDAVPWSLQKNTVLTILSFMNVTKYPPSLVFILVTLGIMFLILALGERSPNQIMSIVSVYGGVPLFYFLGHFLMIHVIMLTVMLFQGFNWTELDFISGTFGRPKGEVSGVSLFGVYLIWVAVVAALYMPCKIFRHYKITHNKWWLRYL
jgi:hypothetical protein